jgi:hypothetical protein
MEKMAERENSLLFLFNTLLLNETVRSRMPLLEIASVLLKPIVKLPFALIENRELLTCLAVAVNRSVPPNLKETLNKLLPP